MFNEQERASQYLLLISSNEGISIYIRSCLASATETEWLGVFNSKPPEVPMWRCAYLGIQVCVWCKNPIVLHP